MDAKFFLQSLCCTFLSVCGHTKFQAEINANMLVLQQNHFTLKQRKKFCTVDNLTYDRVNLPPAHLVYVASEHVTI